jgi:hypothetical protein
MKKLLALLSIVGVAQGLFSEPTRYKHLNELNEKSEIRRKCEEVKLAKFVKGKTEKACDTLDKFFNGEIRGQEVDDALESLGVTDKDVVEIGYLEALAKHILAEERRTSKAIPAIIAS